MIDYIFLAPTDFSAPTGAVTVQSMKLDFIEEMRRQRKAFARRMPKLRAQLETRVFANLFGIPAFQQSNFWNMSMFYRDNGEFTVLAVDKDAATIVGMLTFRETGDRNRDDIAVITSVYVKEEYRQQHIATNMLSQAFCAAYLHGEILSANGFYMDVPLSQESSIALCVEFGFIKTSICAESFFVIPKNVSDLSSTEFKDVNDVEEAYELYRTFFDDIYSAERGVIRITEKGIVDDMELNDFSYNYHFCEVIVNNIEVLVMYDKAGYVRWISDAGLANAEIFTTVCCVLATHWGLGHVAFLTSDKKFDAAYNYGVQQVAAGHYLDLAEWKKVNSQEVEACRLLEKNAAQ